MSDRTITVDEARTRWPCPEGYHLGSVWPIAMALSLGFEVTDTVDIGPPLGEAIVDIVARREGPSFAAYTDDGTGPEAGRVAPDAAELALWFGYLVDDGQAPNTSRELRALLEQHEERRALAGAAQS